MGKSVKSSIFLLLGTLSMLVIGLIWAIVDLYRTKQELDDTRVKTHSYENYIISTFSPESVFTEELSAYRPFIRYCLKESKYVLLIPESICEECLNSLLMNLFINSHVHSDDFTIICEDGTTENVLTILQDYNISKIRKEDMLFFTPMSNDMVLFSYDSVMDRIYELRYTKNKISGYIIQLFLLTTNF